MDSEIKPMHKSKHFPIDQLVCVGNYELEKTIGTGNFAVVELATHAITKRVREIMENRAREQRVMPPTKRRTTKPMKRKQTSKATKATVSAKTAIESEVTTIKIEDDGQPTTNGAATEANDEDATANAPAE